MMPTVDQTVHHTAHSPQPTTKLQPQLCTTTPHVHNYTLYSWQLSASHPGAAIGQQVTVLCDHSPHVTTERQAGHLSICLIRGHYERHPSLFQRLQCGPRPHGAEVRWLDVFARACNTVLRKCTGLDAIRMRQYSATLHASHQPQEHTSIHCLAIDDVMFTALWKHSSAAATLPHIMCCCAFSRFSRRDLWHSTAQQVS